MNNGLRRLINKLHRYDDAYNLGKPEVSDQEYDQLYFQLQELEKETGIVYPDSPTQSIRYEELDKLDKVSHGENPMLSLAKTKDWKEIKSWIGVHPATLSLKLDGLSCRLIYKDGSLVEAHTRGNGIEGNLITAAARTFRNIPKYVPTKETVIIDGEALITDDIFNDFKEEFANSRNLVAGTLAMLDTGKIAERKVSFYAWNLINSNFETYSEGLDFIEEMGFDVVPHWQFMDSMVPEDYRIIAEQSSLPIDGLVVRYYDNEYYRSLGKTEHHFNGSMAFKFADEEYETTLLDIDYDVSRTGQLTPVAVFENVDTGDSVCNRASLHNLSIMKEMFGQPYVGQKMRIAKMNMVIPQVVWAEGAKEYHPNNLIELPVICPVCGGGMSIHISETGVENLFCENPKCERKLAQRLEFFGSKKCLDIKGLSLKTIEKLIDLNWLTEIKDLYTLKEHRAEWIKLPGFGAASVDKILSAIEASKDCSLDRFICGIGIPEIGTKASKDLARFFPSWDIFRKATFAKIIEIPGFGEIMADNIVSFDYEEADELAKLMTHINSFIDTMANIFYEEINTQIEKTLSLIGNTFVITGKLSKKRDDIVAEIEAHGGKVVSSISRKTSYLVNNDINSTTSKNAKAKELGIPIIDEDTLYNMMAE